MNTRIGLSIIIPVYNEAVRLPSTFSHISAYIKGKDYIMEVLFVDDGSVDDTSVLIQKYIEIEPRVRLFATHQNRGKGHAIRRGFSSAKSEYVLFTDADLSTPLQTIEEFLSYSPPYDIVISSRKLPESVIEKKPSLVRRGVSTFGAIVRKLLLLPKIQDTQCGFKLFNKEAINHILALSTIDGYAFDMEALTICKANDLKIKEVGVIWNHNDLGNFKLSSAASSMFADMLRIFLRSISGKYKNRTKI